MSDGGHGGGHVGGHVGGGHHGYVGGGHHGHHHGSGHDGGGLVPSGRRRRRPTPLRILLALMFGLFMAFGSVYLGQLLHH